MIDDILLCIDLGNYYLSQTTEDFHTPEVPFMLFPRHAQPLPPETTTDLISTV